MREILFFYSILFVIALHGQQVKIVDAETGKTVSNVAVYNQAMSLNAISSQDGFIDVSGFANTDLLIFSHVSYSIFRILKSRIPTQNFIVYLQKQSEELDEIVISSFKKDEKSKRIAERIEVLTQKDIFKTSPQTSADLLATVPGIKVQKSQFGGGSPVIRGMEANRVLLVVDGVRLNNAIYRKGHLQNSITIAPTILDKMEVVFGPSSVLYGSDALGGVIHYYTKTPKLAETKQVESEFFSRYSTVNQEITNTFSAEVRMPKWASLTSVSYSDFGDLRQGNIRNHGFSDWGKVYYFSENTPTYYTPNPTINNNPNIQRNTGYTQTDVLQKFFIPLTSKTDLKLNFQYSTTTDVPRFDALAELTDVTNPASLRFAEWYYGPQNRLLLSSQLVMNPSKSWMEKGNITLAYQNIKESRYQRRFTSLNKSFREEYVDIFSVNGDFYVPFSKDNNRIFSYGFEVAHNNVTSRAVGKRLKITNGNFDGFEREFNIAERYPDGGSSFTSASIYADYRQTISKTSTLNTGLRFTHTNLAATWIDQTFIQLADADISFNNAAITATLGYVYKPSENWQLNTVLSTGFRAPNVDDIGRIRENGGNITIPNTNVKPEYAYNAEIGIVKYLNDKKFRLGLNMYYTLLDNYIDRDFVYNTDGSIKQVSFDGDMGNAVINTNKDKAYIFGYTANYFGKISKNVSTSGFITYTKGKTFDTQEPMSSIPPLFGQFEVNHQLRKLQIGAEVRFNSKKDVEDFNIAEGIDNVELTPLVNATATHPFDRYYGSPSWMIFGINANYQLNANFRLQTRLDNLFDEHYIEFASGVASAGRNLSVSFVANF